jgi:hypothetical protein
VLSEYEEQGGQLSWTVDYVYAGSRLLAAVRPNAIELRTGRVGNGTITAAPGGISCGDVCRATYPEATDVTLVATPAPGWWFAYWIGVCSGTNPEVTVTVGSSVTCTARFTDGPNLTVQTVATGAATGRVIIYGDGDCTGACTVTRPQGTSVAVRAVPDPGALFAGWSGACAASGLGLGSSVTLNDNTTCTATFAPAPPFPKLGPAGGTTLQGNAVQLLWNPVPFAQTYWFCVATTPNITCPSGWSVAADLATTALVSGLAPGLYYWQAKVQTQAGGGYQAGRYDADNGMWWTFTVPDSPRTLTITTVTTGSGTGRVLMPDGFECRGTCTTKYPDGATVEFWGVPDSGSMFVGWSGDCSGQGYVQRVPMAGDRSCTVTFTGPAPAASKVAPAHGATVSGPSVELQWDAVPEAYYYHVCVADDPIVTGCSAWQFTTAASLTWGGLAGGDHYWQVRVTTGAGRFDLNGASWRFTIPIAGDHWKAEYFSTVDLSGPVTRVKDEGTGIIDHWWATGAPSGLPVDHFSARYTRTVTFPAGRYRFTIYTDDGSRLFLDGSPTPIINAWWDQNGSVSHEAEVDLTGAHTLRYEFYEHTGAARAYLSWAVVPVALTAPVAVHLRVASGQYVVAEGGGGGAVNADRWVTGGWETFTLEDLNGGTLQDGDPVAFRTSAGYYLQAVSGGGGAMLASDRAAGAWETFTIINLAQVGAPIENGTSIGLLSSGSYYVCAENGGGSVVNVNRSSVGSWETFVLEVASRPAPAPIMTAGGLGALVGPVLPAGLAGPGRPSSAAGWVALALAGLAAALVRGWRALGPRAARGRVRSRVASLSAASRPGGGFATPSPVVRPRRPARVRGLGRRRPRAAPWDHAHDHPPTRCTMSRHMTAVVFAACLALGLPALSAPRQGQETAQAQAKPAPVTVCAPALRGSVRLGASATAATVPRATVALLVGAAQTVLFETRTDRHGRFQLGGGIVRKGAEFLLRVSGPGSHEVTVRLRIDPACKEPVIALTPGGAK